jgi:hypothetical protein
MAQLSKDGFVPRRYRSKLGRGLSSILTKQPAISKSLITKKHPSNTTQAILQFHLKNYFMVMQTPLSQYSHFNLCGCQFPHSHTSSLKIGQIYPAVVIASQNKLHYMQPELD